MKKNTNQTTFWLLTYAANAIILYVAGLLYPQAVVLGNAIVESWTALLVNALLVTVALMMVVPVLNKFQLKLGNTFYMGLIFGIVNVAALWLLSRGANWTGLGLSSVWIAIILGIVLNIVQFIIWKPSMTGKHGKR